MSRPLSRDEAVDLFGVDIGTPRSTAAVRWFGEGFALGAAGARDTQRKGRPRLRAMVPHWRAGIRAGRLARSIVVHLYTREVRS